MADDEYRRDLGHGLIVRWSTPDDMERVAALSAQVFRPRPDAPLNWNLPLWTRDMFSGRHPHIGPRDFAVVEDTRAGTVVASACLLSYTFAYEGISVGFGRPEEVATLPEYRHKGLVRAIFDLLHAKSAARGHLVQGITGIPYFYRQFGYEYAATLGEGLTIYFPAIPALKPDVPEPYTLREATLDDVPALRRLWARAHAGTALWTEIEEEYWRWAMAGMHPESLERWHPYLIAESDGQSSGRLVGALVLNPGRWSAALLVNALMVDAGVPLVRVMPSVLRGVRALAETVRPMRPDTPPAGAIYFRWASPALRGAMGDTPFVDNAYPYAWYLRVADLPRLLHHITPALERRLAESPQAGYTGELTVDFYRGGLHLALEDGKLTAIEDWQRSAWGEAQAGFPPLVFLQALFGHRCLDELRHIYPDVWAEGDAAPLLDALFPRRPSLLVPLD